MLKTIRNLDYVVLLCDNLPSMKAFYHDVLGFPVYRDWGEWYELRTGASLLTLRPRGRPYDGPGGTAGIQLAFRVAPDEIDSCYTELVAKSVEIVEPPEDKHYGHRTVFFRDPDGNILEIYADVPVKQHEGQ